MQLMRLRWMLKDYLYIDEVSTVDKVLTVRNGRTYPNASRMCHFGRRKAWTY